MGVEVAEALAEYWHRQVRLEMGIGDQEPEDQRLLFSARYHGARYSFGYPACPNLEDQAKLFELLRPEEIGITLSEEFMLVPEQSTSAIVVHHPEAKYFNIR
jgi:5-methyltetrahydrofolate--homocysteine methyltransferase